MIEESSHADLEALKWINLNIKTFPTINAFIKCSKRLFMLSDSINLRHKNVDLRRL